MTSKSKTLARHGSLDEYVDSLPAYENQPVVDDTFNDDTVAQTFSDLEDSLPHYKCPECDTSYKLYHNRVSIERDGMCRRCFDMANAGKMRLIGIAGQARSGKDTLASYMLDNLGGTWLRSSFADPMKAMLSAIDVDTSDEAKDLPSNQYGLSTRHMLQTLGTEWGRDRNGNNFWIDVFARSNAGKCVIVPDVRFDNEAELVRANGVLIHLVGRGGIEGNHVSENAIAFKPGDIVIDNSRDLAWLHSQVDGNAVLGEFIAEVSE